jgi:hypothetical protein
MAPELISNALKSFCAGKAVLSDIHQKPRYSDIHSRTENSSLPHPSKLLSAPSHRSHDCYPGIQRQYPHRIAP